MICFTLPFIAVLVSRFASVIADETSSLLFNDACQEIALSISAASDVYSVLSLEYLEDIDHWASSSSQEAACSFEPGTAEDVGIAIQILAKSRTPFAIKGGGHTGNLGFSSTLGVQIAMSRFSEVSYDSESQTAVIGAGLIWDDVYAALEPYGVNVVGGRVTGVGVGGLILGGGYSWLSNQYGLAIDNVLGYEVVLPNGTVIDVTETTSPDLFFALKGGLNNFGVVTKFTLKTFPQTEVWGGLIIYPGLVFDQVNQATANFAANNDDPKAAMITTYNCLVGVPSAIGLFFYDGPEPPKGVFDEFLEIPSLIKDVSTRSYLSLARTWPSNVTSETRGVFNTISPTSFPLSLLKSIVNETLHWCEELLLDPAVFVSYNVEPVMPTYLTHSTSPSAYPPSRSEPFFPLGIYYSWLLPTSDQAFQDAVRTSASTLKAAAVNGAQGNTVNPPLYSNYAIFDTPLEDLFGANLPRLRAIKAEVDPDNVMGLAGGFKLRLHL